MSVFVGFELPERRVNVVAFDVELSRLHQFPTSVSLLASLDFRSEARHPIELVLPPTVGTAGLEPYLGSVVSAVIGPREPCGGIVGVDLELLLLRADDDPRAAVFAPCIGASRRMSDRLVIPVTQAELVCLGTYFVTPARLTLGIFEQCDVRKRSTPESGALTRRWSPPGSSPRESLERVRRSGA